jgi:phage terminase small subunit
MTNHRELLPEKKAPPGKLTRKQQVFVREYLVDLNASQACIRAGYSQRNAGKIGPRLVGQSSIAEAIQNQLKKRLEAAEITADFVLMGIKETIRVCVSAGQHSNVLKGYELLGRHLRLFADKAENPGIIQVQVITGIPRLPNDPLKDGTNDPEN